MAGKHTQIHMTAAAQAQAAVSEVAAMPAAAAAASSRMLAVVSSCVGALHNQGIAASAHQQYMLAHSFTRKHTCTACRESSASAPSLRSVAQMVQPCNVA